MRTVQKVFGLNQKQRAQLWLWGITIYCKAFNQCAQKLKCLKESKTKLGASCCCPGQCICPYNTDSRSRLICFWTVAPWTLLIRRGTIWLLFPELNGYHCQTNDEIISWWRDSKACTLVDQVQSRLCKKNAITNFHLWCFLVRPRILWSTRAHCP